MENSRSVWLLAQLCINVASSCSNLCAAHLFCRLFRANRAASLLGLLLLSTSEFVFDLSHLLFTASNLLGRACEGDPAPASNETAATAEPQPATGVQLWLCIGAFAPSNACLFIRNWWITLFTIVRCFVIVWPFTARTVFTKRLYARSYAACVLLGIVFTGLRVWAAFASDHHLLRFVMIVQAPVPSLLVFGASVLMVADLVKIQWAASKRRRLRRQQLLAAASPLLGSPAGHAQPPQHERNPPRTLGLNEMEQQQQQQQHQLITMRPMERPRSHSVIWESALIDHPRRQSNSRGSAEHGTPNKKSRSSREKAAATATTSATSDGADQAASRVLRATITIASVAVLFVVLETPCSIFVFLGLESSLTEHISNTLIGVDSLLNFVVFMCTSCTFRSEFLTLFGSAQSGRSRRGNSQRNRPSGCVPPNG